MTKVFICFLLLALSINCVGQNTLALKHNFLKAIKYADEAYIGSKKEQVPTLWETQNTNDAFSTRDTVVFYNYRDNPASKQHCQLATWMFYKTSHLDSETKQTCEEPASATAHPDGSRFYKISFTRSPATLILNLTNHLMLGESYKILSVQKDEHSIKGTFHYVIVLVRLPSFSTL